MIKRKAAQVIIEPWDPAVNRAKQQIDRLDPSLLKNVKKIIVHPGGGGGQLGHVEMGGGKDPQEIHIFKDRIREHVMQNAKATVKKTLSPQELEQAIVNGLTEVLAHESGHIGGKTRTPEQIAKGPFFGEPQAEQTAKSLMSRIVPANQSFKLSKRAAKTVIDLHGGRIESARDEIKGFDDRLTGLKVRTTTWPDADAELTGSFFVRGYDSDNLRLKVKYTGESSLGETYPQYVPLEYITLLSNIEITWEPDIEEKMSINNKSFALSKRAADIGMACPRCKENVSHLKPEKTPAGLTKMLTCPYCKEGFYPQDALIVLKEKEQVSKEPKEIKERPEWNMPDKGWWGIWIGSDCLGFFNNEAGANAAKRMIIQRFLKGGIEAFDVEPLKGMTYEQQREWRRKLTRQQKEEFLKNNIGVIGNKIEGALIGLPYDMIEDEVYPGLKHIDYINQIDEKRHGQYRDASEELKEQIDQLIKNPEFNKKKERFIDGLVNINKLPPGLEPNKQSVVSGGLPTTGTEQSAFEDVQDWKYQGEEQIVETGRQNLQKSKDATREFVGGVVKSIGNKYKATQKGLDRSKLCDDPPLKKKVNEFILDAALALDDVRAKYFPDNPIVEPDLKFATYASNNDQSKIVKYGLSLVQGAETAPLLTALNEAAVFNRAILKDTSNAKLYGLISQFSINFNDYELITNVAKWQNNNGLEITGKLDKDTIKKLSETSNPKSLPRNFDTVVPGVLYRGGLVMDESQLQALKDLGVQRVVSLHSNPDIPRLCNKMGVEHIPAFIENGGPEDLGRKIFGNSVSEFLTEKPTYVHCFFGDRTGGVIARFRTETGWPCKLAYAEAKAHGFKDIFVDLIDWFSERCNEKPVNTDRIRKMLEDTQPYQNPEVITQEQDCSLPTPAPDDVPFQDMEPTSFPSYKNYITSPIPTSISTVPLSIRSSIEINAYEVRTQEDEEKRDEEWEEEEENPAVNIVGLQDDETKSNMNEGLALEPIFDTETAGGIGAHS